MPAISEARRCFPRFSCLPLPCYGTMAAAALTHAAWEPSVGFKPQFTPEGEPDYSHWINSVHWSSRRMLLSREGTASSLYSGTGRVYLPSAVGTRNMPRDVYPYTLRIADRDLPTIEGQLALLWHVILYEDRTGRTILSSSQRWDFYFVTPLLGCLSVEELYKFTLTTQQVTREQNTPYSSTVSASKAFSAVFRHEAVHRNDLDEMNSLPIGSCNTRKLNYQADKRRLVCRLHAHQLQGKVFHLRPSSSMLAHRRGRSARLRYEHTPWSNSGSYSRKLSPN